MRAVRRSAASIDCVREAVGCGCRQKGIVEERWWYVESLDRRRQAKAKTGVKKNEI